MLFSDWLAPFASFLEFCIVQLNSRSKSKTIEVWILFQSIIAKRRFISLPFISLLTDSFEETFLFFYWHRGIYCSLLIPPNIHQVVSSSDSNMLNGDRELIGVPFSALFIFLCLLSCLLLVFFRLYIFYQSLSVTFFNFF